MGDPSYESSNQAEQMKTSITSRGDKPRKNAPQAHARSVPRMRSKGLKASKMHVRNSSDMLTNREKPRPGLLNDTLKAQRYAGTQSAMVLEKSEPNAEGEEKQWLEYAEAYNSELKHPLLRSQQIG